MRMNDLGVTRFGSTGRFTDQSLVVGRLKRATV
jgi:hypothetical protein